MIREYRIKRLKKKLKKREDEFEYFFQNKNFLTEQEYTTVADVICEEMANIKKTLSRLEKR